MTVLCHYREKSIPAQNTNKKMCEFRKLFSSFFCLEAQSLVMQLYRVILTVQIPLLSILNLSI